MICPARCWLKISLNSSSRRKKNKFIKRFLRDLQGWGQGKKRMTKVQHYEETSRFANGGEHIDEPEEDDEEGGSWCAIM